MWHWSPSCLQSCLLYSPLKTLTGVRRCWRPVRMETVLLQLLSSAWWASSFGMSSSGGAWSRRDCLRSDSRWTALWGGIACNAQQAKITFSTGGQAQRPSPSNPTLTLGKAFHMQVWIISLCCKWITWINDPSQHLNPWQADIMWTSTHLKRKKAT